MAAIVLVVLFSHMHRTQEHRASAVETAKLDAATPTGKAIIMPPCAAAAGKRFEEGKRSVQLPAVRRVRGNHREYRHAANLLSYPLTRQEKLLVRFVQTAKPADLQALNPEYQAKVEAQQDAEFVAYLKSGSSSDTESATVTTESTQK
jgi:hypothetical protein